MRLFPLDCLTSYKNVVDVDDVDDFRVFIDVDDFREHLLPSDYLVTVHLNL